MTDTTQPTKKILGPIALAMITIVAIVDLRGSSMMATYGLSVVFIYVMAALLFLVPSGFVSAELSTMVHESGGMYTWIRKAFGEKVGFLAIWLEWLNNVIGFPASLSFIAVTLVYLVNPELVHHKLLILSLTLIILWLITLFTLQGMRASSRLNMVGAIVGTIIPAIIITVLAVIWISLQKKLQITLAWKNVLPDWRAYNPGFFAAIILGFGGMHLIAFHNGDAHNPRRDYPRAILMAVICIFLVALLSAFSIATVVPAEQLNLISGFIESFYRFFNAFGISWATPVIIIMIVSGLLATLNAWFLGPARGLAIAAEKGYMPKYFARLNKHNVPANVLIAQAVVCTLLSLLFLAMPDVTSGFWILLNLSSQSALLVYILVFAAGIKLRHQQRHLTDPSNYKIPGGRSSMAWVAGIGIVTCAIALITSVIPPAMVQTGNLWHYESILFGSNVVFLGAPLVMLGIVGYLRRKREVGAFTEVLAQP